MGCGNTKHAPPPNVPQPVAQVDEAAATVSTATDTPVSRHIPIDHANDLVATLDFELSTAMLVMPFEHFKKQKRIVKSTKTWRDEALSNGWLVAHVKGAGDVPAPGKVVIFTSHTWWDREFKDETNQPDDPYDKGCPDSVAKW